MSRFSFSPGLSTTMRACSVRVFGSSAGDTYEILPWKLSGYASVCTTTSSPLFTYSRSAWYTLASTHTVLRSEMVNACVCPACTTCPGETSRSTTSPAIGASTGIRADEGALASCLWILDAQNPHALLSRVQVSLRLGAIALRLLQVLQRNRMVRIQVLRARV